MKYNYILLDADGTVFDFARAEADAINGTLLSNGIAPTKALISVYSAINDKLWHELENGRIAREKLKTERFRLFAERCALTADAEKMSEDYMRLLSGCGYYLPGAQRFLQTVYNAGCKIALVTNGLEKVQTGRIRASGIDKYLQSVIISETFGCSKPDVRLAQAALTALDCTDKTQAVMIGDSDGADIALGINAGIATCHYCAGCKPSPRATYCAESYSDILSILEIQ